jgi:glycosyltransferase involved in cell wall biosynthesis
VRIGIDVSCLEVARTGVRTYVEELLAALGKDREHTVIPLRPASTSKAGGKLSKTLRHFRHQSWMQFGLPNALRRAGCEVLLGPEYEVPLRTPCPRVPVFHDAAFWANPTQYNPIWRAIMNRTAVPAARASQRVITDSKHAKVSLVEHLAFPEDRVHVIPIAAKHLPVPSPELVQATLARFGVRKQRFYLHVGVLEHRKNLVRLVHAFARDAHSHDLALVLAGQSAPKKAMDATAAIRSAISQHGLESRVRLTGFVESAEVAALYRNALAFVFPSQMEGFGIPILEAFEHDLPVLCADATSLPEVAGDAALYFSPIDCDGMADTMTRISRDESLRADLVSRGRSQSHQFSWSRTARETIGVLEAALQC